MTGENARPYYEQASLWDHVDREDQERIEMMAQMVPGDVETVADLGCGSGLFVAEIGKTRRAVGLDWSLEALKRFTGAAVAGDIGETPFRDGTFDLVTCSEVLEHLPVDDFQNAIQEITRLTKRWLLITVPYEEVLEAGFSRCADCGCVYHAHRHVRSFSADTLASLFPGFQIVRWKPFGRVEWIGRLEAGIWHTIGGHWVATETGRCPQCGSQKKMTPDRGPRDLLGLALARAIRVFHAPEKPRWLLALLKREPSVS